MRVDTFIDIVESKAQLPAGRDGKIERQEMAAAFAIIESAEQTGQLFFDQDSAQWKIRSKGHNPA
jgi:hypothetical protein|eukprot:COSAG03_NODE_7354_length_929_cov_1.800000_2_plen_65_part_00